MATATETQARSAPRRPGRRVGQRVGLRAGRADHEATSDVLADRRWRGCQRRGTGALPWAVGLLTLALVVVVLASIAAMIDKDVHLFELDRCRDRAFSCGIVGGLLVTILPLALASAFLVIYRVEHVRRKYLAF